MERDAAGHDDAWVIVHLTYDPAGFYRLTLAPRDGSRPPREVLQTVLEAEALVAQLCIALRTLAHAHPGTPRAAEILAREGRIPDQPWAKNALAMAGTIDDVGVLITDDLATDRLFLALYTGEADRLCIPLRYDDALQWVATLCAGFRLHGRGGRAVQP